MKQSISLLFCCLYILAYIVYGIQQPANQQCQIAKAVAERNLESTETSAEAKVPDVNAAASIRAVRESENWIHTVDSLLLRIEGKWTITQEGVAARQTEFRRNHPDAQADSNHWSVLRQSPAEILEYAIDQQRFRFLHYSPGEYRILKIWDGRQATSHEEYFTTRQEQYYRGAIPQSIQAVSQLRYSPPIILTIISKMQNLYVD